jgi:hypothetical protein
LGTVAAPQVLLFDNTSDSVNVAGNTTLAYEATFEARFMLTCGSGGVVYNEWRDSQEDKRLEVSLSGLESFAFPVNYSSPLLADAPISLGQWHHAAYVYDGAEERLYLDGMLVKARSAWGLIGNNDFDGLFHIGAIFRDGALRTTFLGLLDTIRVSDVARYKGDSFSAPEGDLSPEPGTLLLYNFNDPHDSPTVQDESGSGFTGTLGGGGGGVTMPRLIDGERCYADCDQDCAYSADLFDFLCFVNKFNAGEDYADCDGNGALDLFDFLCFVNLFNEGCY